jgi:acetoin utilization protein AcuB
MFVRNWMSAPAVVIPPVVPADAALGFMEKRQIRRVPVVDEGRLVGIVTRSDLESTLGRGRDGRRGKSLSVSDLMTPDPVTVAPDDTLEAAAETMLRKKVSGLPVVDGERVAGIITESDLFRALCQILGIGERGARIVMSVPDDEDLFARISSRLGGLAVRSLATFHDARHRRWDVVLRARGRVPGALGKVAT